MDKKIILSICILISGIFISYTLVAQALTEKDIVYPVAELGNCKNEKECRAYCDKPENMDVCLSFAEKYNLISEEELQAAKKFAEIGKGPGGCTSESSCEAYCDDIANMDECIAFAEEHGILPPDELKEAKLVQAALKKGLKQPGNCRNKKECDAYCDESEHMEECIAFAEAAGFMKPEDKEDAQKVLAAIKGGAKPPPCRGKKECDTYCSKPDNMKQCMEFAIAAGFMKPEEMEEAQKVLDAIKKGVNPPPCKSKEECDKWCAESDENMTVCTKFAAAAGFMSEEEAEMALKTGGKGPGGCRGKEECEKFCQDSANQETCFNFAKEHGMIPEEDLKNMERGREQMMQGLEQAPPEVMECLKETVGAEVLEKLKSGTFMPSRDLGEKMQQCFEKVMQKMGPPQGIMDKVKGMIPGGKGKKEGVSIKLKQDGGSFEIEIESSKGIQEFSFKPADGSSAYGGGLSGCPKEYKTLTVFDPAAFPLAAYVIDCEGNRTDISISSAGEYKARGGAEEEMMFPTEGMMPEGMAGPGGCKTPEECEKYCKEHQEECMKFGPAMPSVEEGGQGIFNKIKDFGNRVIDQFKPVNGEGERIPQEMQPGLIQQMTPEMINCLRSALGDEMVEKMKKGEMPSTPELSKKMKPCVEMYKGAEMMPPQMPQQQMMQEQMQKVMSPEGMVVPPAAPIPGTGTSPENKPPMDMQQMQYPTAPIPSGQYGPSQYTPPTGPGAGEGMAPGEIGPGPGTAPPPSEQTAPPQNLQGFILQTLSGMFRLLIEK